MTESASKIRTRELTLHYGKNKALNQINLDISEHTIVSLIGPSGCGKSSFLRCLNRMNDLIADTAVTGSILYDSRMEINDPQLDVTYLRRQIGMVFQKPNPFPKSVYDNIAYGLRLQQKLSKSEEEGRVEEALRRVGIWKEVGDRLEESALALSGGQAQRLCIARAIATNPSVILMDEPTSALDPISTQVIEELMLELKEKYTLVVVTHNMQQAARVSDFAAFFYLGSLIEFNPTNRLFTNPVNELTEKYVTGRFG